MTRPWRPALIEHAVTASAGALWHACRAMDRLRREGTFQPAWAPAPIPGAEQDGLELGWPRTTDSLCPGCVRELRGRALAAGSDPAVLRQDRLAGIPARILERDGQIVIEKDCPLHGHFSDTLSIDPEFTRRIERLFPGRDYPSVTDSLHDHGRSSVRYGRGGVLTVDLTNRCNMMCEPCFMDANQVGYVYELTLDEVKARLDNALTIKPRRQMSVQFSGGEPTLSPIFLEAVEYAQRVGYFSVQAATNGIRFAQEPEFARRSRAAGLRLAYLQFDGVGDEAQASRKVPNLFEVKLRAIENLYAAGIDVVLVVTVVRTVNDDQVGRIVRFAIENADKISFVAFQPVSFTGRDEDLDEETRARQRYTLSHLAHDLQRQTGATEPLRDWFPISAVGAAADVTDLVKGEHTPWGTLKCGCHPDCGIATGFLVNKRTRAWAPLTRLFDVERFLDDMRLIAAKGRGAGSTGVRVAFSLLRNYRPGRGPDGLRLLDLVRKFDKQSGGALGGRLGARDNTDRKADDWLILFVAGMAFQDLWTYDFRRTEMCLIPYATEEGEISFCAYNTGVGWREIVETRYRKATLADWYKKQGRHPVYANGRKLVPLPVSARPAALSIPADGRLARPETTGESRPERRRAPVAVPIRPLNPES